MRNQIVQWIFLPGGLTGDGQLAASIFVAPRLKSDENSTLADFPDFADWPAMVNGGRLNVTLQRDDLTAERAMQVTGGGSSSLWKALFPPETPVRPFRFHDYADRPLITYPLRPVLDYLSSKWARLTGWSADELPISSMNASPIGPALQPRQLEGRTLSVLFKELMAVKDVGILKDASDAGQLSQRMDELLRNAAAQAAALAAQHHEQPQKLIQPFATGETDADRFYQLRFFHRRPKRAPVEFPREMEAARSQLAEKTEFHHLLSVLGDHPDLLRALGLVFDLIIRPDFLPTLTDLSTPSGVRVLIDRPSNFPIRSNPDLPVWNLDVTPFTKCRLSTLPDGGASFSAAENVGNQDMVHGFVLMDPKRFSVVGVDVDGLALKVLNMAATLDIMGTKWKRPVEEEARSGTPAPRTGGIALVHTGRAQNMHDDFYGARRANDGLETNPMSPPDLFAEQLVRGYRLDVRDAAAGKWHSLHARQVDYTPLRNPGEAFSVQDEGFVQDSLAGEVDRPDAPADPNGALYVHESLITWDGWSLASQRPGLPIAQEPAAPEPSADTSALKLDIKVRPLPASLPRLRFGASYQVRLRTVDLAGRSHTLDRANNLTTSLDGSGLQQYRVTLPDNGFIYRRFEPVPPPALVARAIFSPGESLERPGAAEQRRHLGRGLCGCQPGRCRRGPALSSLLRSAYSSAQGIASACRSAWQVR